MTSEYRWVYTPDTAWLDPKSTGDLEHKLRYGRPQEGDVRKMPYSNSDLLVAASALACYRELVRLPRREREKVITAMRQKARKTVAKSTTDPKQMTCLQCLALMGRIKPARAR